MVAGLHRNFGSLQVLKGIDFTAHAGEILSLVGPNGAGKTTLIRCLADGLERSGGTVRVYGEDLGRRPPDACTALGIGRKFQAANVFATLTVAECLRVARFRLEPLSCWRRAGVLRLPDAAVRIAEETGLAAALDVEARHLSHGQKQALELAMVLALEPGVVLLDEPTAGLTRIERQRIGAILTTLAERERLSILLVEHDLDFVRDISSRVIVLHQGRIVLDATVDEVVESELVRTIYAGTAGATARGRAMSALAVVDLSSGYGEAIVVRAASIEVGRGEIVAVLGKNGMGKSTLLKTVMGYLPARTGRVRVFDEDVTGAPPHRVARRAVAFTPQEQAIFQDLTVEDNLKLALPDPGWFASGFARVGETFPFLRERRRQRAGTLSGGEQKMLLVARALMARPRLMLVDEITEGLQPSVVRRLAGVFADERDRLGTAMLLVEQNVRFALDVADRWAVLKLGEIVDRGSSRDADAAARIEAHLAV